MLLTRQQQQWLDGEGGPALQWAMHFNESPDNFYCAPQLLPVSSAHFAPDTRMAGSAGQTLLGTLVADGARIRVRVA
jgi:predicted aconitase